MYNGQWALLGRHTGAWHVLLWCSGAQSLQQARPLAAAHCRAMHCTHLEQQRIRHDGPIEDAEPEEVPQVDPRACQAHSPCCLQMEIKTAPL